MSAPPGNLQNKTNTRSASKKRAAAGAEAHKDKDQPASAPGPVAVPAPAAPAPTDDTSQPPAKKTAGGKPPSLRAQLALAADGETAARIRLAEVEAELAKIRGDAVVGDVTNVDADDDLASAFNRDKPAGTVTGKPTATGSGATAKAGTIDAYFQPPRPDGTTAPPTVTAGRDTHADPKGSNPAASTAQPAPTTSRYGPRPEIKVYRQAPAAQHDQHKTKP